MILRGSRLDLMSDWNRDAALYFIQDPAVISLSIAGHNC
jgi:hypothetical protein